MKLAKQTISWPATAEAPPKLTNNQWSMIGLLGVLLFVMAILQVISFTDFRDWFRETGVSGPSVWAAAVIFAELWAAVCFFQIRLSRLFRWVGGGLAVLVSGFWFVENLQLVSGDKNLVLTNSGFFGRFLSQTPGWWSVIEVTVLLFWTIYAVDLLQKRRQPLAIIETARKG